MGRKSAADLEQYIKETKGLELHGKALRLNFSYRNTRCRETLPIPITAKNIEYAKGLLSTIKHQIKTRTFRYAEHFPDSPNAARFGSTAGSTTISKLAAQWLTAKIEITEPVKRRYESVLKRLKKTLGKHRIDTLLKSDVEAYRNNLLLDLAPSTANYHISFTKQVLSYAFDNKFTDEDKAKWLKKFKLDTTPPDPLTVKEFEDILSKGCLSEFDRNWYTVAVWTGLRTSELCALSWGDIDLDKAQAVISRNVTENHTFKLPKNGKERTIALLPPVVEALKSQWLISSKLRKHKIKVALNELKKHRTEHVQFVFPPSVQSRRDYHKPCYFSVSRAKNWSAVLKRAGVRHRRQYQTRHTFACWALTFHGNPVFVANQMGHKDFTEIVETYGKWMPEETQFEVEKIWDFYTQKFPNSAPRKNDDPLQASNTKA